MMKRGIGRALFAASFAALGVFSLVAGDFALNWQPVPTWVPWRTSLARLSGVMLLGSGAGCLWTRSARLSAFVLTLNLSIWLVLLQLPRILINPTNEAIWLGFAENVVMIAGGLMLIASQNPAEEAIVNAARFMIAISLLPIGLSRFVYADQTAALVPSWLPDRVALAYSTGAAHIMAGIALLFGIVPRLAASLEATMVGSFTLLVWAPRVVSEPVSRVQWTAFLVSSALTGAIWTVATAFDNEHPQLA
jgi:uncharacterized membrane protein